MRHCGLEVYLYHESVAYIFRDLDSYQIISFEGGCSDFYFDKNSQKTANQIFLSVIKIQTIWIFLEF